ncbi:MAG TPA: type II CAAX endopeptidase family protein [Syntrophobacteraceae bacterium]|nr:type II CAAX endopeptidase family protein [Syntrophobacteraceae bacterium]
METAKANDYRRKDSRLHGALVLLCLVFFGMSVFPKFGFCEAVLFLLMLSGLYLRLADVFVLGLTCGLMSFLCRVASISSLWPLPMVFALGAALIAGRLIPFTRGAFGWIKRGNWGRQEIAMTAVVAAISGISLVCWYFIVKPDISDIASRIPDVHPVEVILIGVLFSISNAICEEALWRGMIFDAVERVFSSSAAVIFIQALSFGAAHLNGFPRGVSGMVLATIYGCILGYVRQCAKGLMAPIAAHALADAVVYSILVFAALAGVM